MTNHDNKIVLFCHVLDGFEPKELRGKRIPYKSTATFTQDEYDRSKSLQIAVKNGWLTMMRNVPRKLNLSFAKRPEPRRAETQKSAALPVASPPSAPVQASLDRESLKQELRAEVMAEVLPELVSQLSQSQAEMIQKMIESNKENAAQIQEALANVSVSGSGSGNGVVRPIRRKGEEIFIPDQIRTEELKATVNPNKSESGSLDDEMAALKKLRGRE